MSNPLNLTAVLAVVICWSCVDFSLAQQARGQIETAEDAHRFLLSFSCLGCFADRGVSVSPFYNAANSKAVAEMNEQFESLPKDVKEVLSQERVTPQIEGMEFPWVASGQKPSGGEALNRFCRFSLIELFYIKDCSLIDSPLESRAGMRDTVKKIFAESSKAHLILFTQGTTRNEKIVAVGLLRRMSVDLDFAILNALSAEEKIRLAKFLIHLMPIAENLANQDHDGYSLGSTNLNPRGSGGTTEEAPQPE